MRYQNEVKYIESTINDIQFEIRQYGKVVSEDDIYKILGIGYNWSESDTKILDIYTMLKTVRKRDIAEYIYNEYETN